MPRWHAKNAWDKFPLKFHLNSIWAREINAELITFGGLWMMMSYCLFTFYICELLDCVCLDIIFGWFFGSGLEEAFGDILCIFLITLFFCTLKIDFFLWFDFFAVHPAAYSISISILWFNVYSQTWTIIEFLSYQLLLCKAVNHVLWRYF